MTGQAERTRDFFISYNHQDETWAKWIAQNLEKEGYSVYIQAWDFLPGGNFVVDMQNAAANSRRTLAILSPTYLASLYSTAEWAAAFVQDPTSEKRLLIPVRVQPCDLTGLHKAIVYIDLVGKSEPEAHSTLLQGIAGVQQRPTSPQVFPGTPAPIFPPAVSPAVPDTSPAQSGISDAVILKNPTRHEISEQFRKREGLIVVRGLNARGLKDRMAPIYSEMLPSETKLLYTDFDTYPDAQFNDVEAYFKALAADVASSLRIDFNLSKHWKRRLGPQSNMLNFVRDYMMTTTEGILLWRVHHVDRLVSADFSDDAFSFFRVLYNEGWERLIMVLCCYNDPNTFIKNAQMSPFNVGVRLEFA